MKAPARQSRLAELPDFPWDTLTEAKNTAMAHPEGIVNLSVGTPVDPVDELIREALHQASAQPGYPTTHGTPQLRDTIAQHMQRRYEVSGIDPEAVLPVVGTKEFIAWLPTLLGIGPGHSVVIPHCAYPTYEVGALMAGAQVLRADSLVQLGPQIPTLLFINSPSNPTGKVLGIDHLRKVVSWAREHNVIVASDECYLGLTWEDDAYSILHPDVCDGDFSGLLAIGSLSKTSNMASYRSGYIAGDPQLIAELLGVRKHCGLMVPLAVQHAMMAAFADDEHQLVQAQKYRARRTQLKAALEEAGFTIDHSQAGLYLWSTCGQDSRKTVDLLASIGILVAPGDFYGPAGQQHVRIALTESDERVSAACARLKNNAHLFQG